LDGAVAITGVQPSMGTAGDVYDNAVYKSFFGTLEAELLAREHFTTHEQGPRRFFWFLEGRYNVRCLQGSIGYGLPLEFEELNAKTQTIECGLPTARQRHGRDRRPAAWP
jgi:transposase InsO family protein